MPRKRLLALSYLFPNVEKPNHGIFVYNRLNAMAKYADITVINPIPWSPLHFFINKFKHLRNIPVKTQRGNLTIYHPQVSVNSRIRKKGLKFRPIAAQ